MIVIVAWGGLLHLKVTYKYHHWPLKYAFLRCQRQKLNFWWKLLTIKMRRYLLVSNCWTTGSFSQILMLKVYTFFIFLIKKCCCFIKTSKNLQFLCGRVGSESFDGRKFDKRSCKHCRRNIFFLPEQIILYALQRVWLY